MAEFSIVVFPVDSDLIPSEDQIAEAKLLMEDYFPDRGNEVEWSISRTAAQLVTSGHSFEFMTCPSCRKRIERFGDHEDWWDGFEQALDDSADPPNETISVPCCGSGVKARELVAGSEAAFSKFQLTLDDPGDEIEVTDEQLRHLEQALGCKLLQFACVYS